MPPPSSEGPPLDDEMLSLIHRCFGELAGPESGLDVAKLQRSLEVKNAFVAQRVLAVFDRNSDGLVSRVEFVRGVPRLLFGSLLDKLRFAFRVHDLNSDGIIDRAELMRMLELGLSEDGVPADPLVVGRFSDVLLGAADVNHDGGLSFREFEAVASRHPECTALIAKSEASWIAPRGELTERPPGPGLWHKISRFVDNRLALVGLIAVWVFANAALATHAVVHYRSLGANGFVQVARGAGACINLNGALILLTMARRMLSYARRLPLVRHLPIDDSVALHRGLGTALLALSLVHTAAHGANWAAHTPSLFGTLWQSSAGRSGVALLAVFGAMWAFSRPRVRASGHFELFYYTHLLYVLWFALALVHGKVFWLWAGIPLLVFAADRGIRLLRGTAKTEVLTYQPLASGVTKLTLEKPADFRHRAGDYLYLKVPALAPHEWHPFTISSAPESTKLTLHVRSLGNYTSALHALAVELSHLHSPPMLSASIDGPYGTASGRIFESRNAVLIGAGIGVTPFASVLESIVMRGQEGVGPLERVIFYWLNRDAVSFEWFAELLANLERNTAHTVVDIRIFMTAGRGNVSASFLNLARAIAHDLGDPDVFTGLRSMTQMGAPDWRAELTPLAERHRGSLDVFFCGPPGLARSVRAVCDDLELPFYQEQF
jgi:predicted ferric reductase/Ca2+-binding EF-hand superfamily protein